MSANHAHNHHRNPPGRHDGTMTASPPGPICPPRHLQVYAEAVRSPPESLPPPPHEGTGESPRHVSTIALADDASRHWSAHAPMTPPAGAEVFVWRPLSHRSVRGCAMPPEAAVRATLSGQDAVISLPAQPARHQHPGWPATAQLIDQTPVARLQKVASTGYLNQPER